MKKNYHNKNRYQTNIANIVWEHDQDQCMFYTTEDLIRENRGSWYLDSGFSNYMAKDETIFKSIDQSVKVKVRLENDSVIESKGKCTIMMETDKGTQIIHEILLVLRLKENLLSICQMMERATHFNLKKVCTQNLRHQK